MSTPSFEPSITIAVRVSDLDKSIAWYQDVLGFGMLYRVDEIAWCEMSSNTPGVNIGLSQVENASGGDNSVPVFAVENVDQARALLESKDVRFDGETQVIPDMVKLATFFDPDGNTYMLSESLGEM